MTDTTETIRANFEKKIDSFVEGDLEHATEMLCALWKTANKDGNIGAPSTTQSNVRPFLFSPSPCCPRVLISVNQPAPVTSPAHWNSVKTALVKSIRTGVFFDRKYWARHSNTGDALRPVYFSSAIMDDKTHQLSKCESEFTHKLGDQLSVPCQWSSTSRAETLRSAISSQTPTSRVIMKKARRVS